MAMKAGRVGVSPQDVDNRGRVKAGGLTPSERAKLDKALVTPVTAPTEKEIVAVGTGNDQIMIKIGTGLKLTGETSPYTLESESAGGGGVVFNVTTANKATELYRVAQETASTANIVSEATPSTYNCPGLWKVDVSNVEYVRFAVSKNSVGSKSENIYAMFSDKDFTEETGSGGPGYVYLESTTSRSTLSSGIPTGGKKYLYFSTASEFPVEGQNIFVIGY